MAARNPKRWFGALTASLLVLVASFGSAAAAPAVDPVGASDHFDQPNLDLDVWTLVDPTGAGQASIALGTLAFTPAGDSWELDESTRVEQSVDDGPFDVTLEVPALPTTEYTAVGLTVGRPSGWTRIGFTGTGTGTAIVAIANTGGSPLVRLQHPVDETATRMRVRRIGPQYLVWSASEADDWAYAGSFVEAGEVDRLSLFGAARGALGESVAISNFDAAGPVPETGPDDQPPLIHSVTTRARGDQLVVSFFTDELARGSIIIGGETLAATSVQQLRHEIIVPELGNGETVTFFAVAEDEAGNRAESDPTEIRFTHAGLPEIDVWYGDRQVFGGTGIPQQWINLLGRVSDDGEVVEVTYSLDGSTPIRLRRGPTAGRLTAPGDFNVELAFDQLSVGEHEVELAAIDDEGNPSTRVITVVIERSEGLLLPHTVDWAEAVTSLNDIAQVVDGDWTNESDGSIRIAERGYDRMVAVGDRRWTDYEVLVPFTVHTVDPAAYDTDAGELDLGVIVGWTGHHAEDDKRPASGWWPSTGAAGVAWDPLGRSRLIVQADGGSPAESAPPTPLPLGEVIWLRVRVEHASGGPTISARIWEDGSDEPDEWTVSVNGDPSAGAGSVAILADHVDVSVGKIVVEPLSP